MAHAIVFDCEFLVSEGAQARYWCGPYDPDPIVIQIGAAKLDLSDGFNLVDQFEAIITPLNRTGKTYDIPDTFVKLTGITADRIACEGIPLPQAMDAFAEFANADKLWSWGKDEFNLMAITCYLAGIPPSLPALQFDNACKLLLKAGMPYEDLKCTQSGKLAEYFGVDESGSIEHNAVDDSLSVARVLQHLLVNGQLKPQDFV